MLSGFFAEAWSLPSDRVWAIRRLAGAFRDDEGGVVGIANTPGELLAVQRLRGEGIALRFAGSGFHDEQLALAELFAWRRTECAARLQYMAEERGRPRPSAFHPGAEADDPDGACYTAIYKLLKLILDQDDSKEARTLCKEIKKDIRVISAKTK